MSDTIYALSSGGLPSGVAIIRISGPFSRDILTKICKNHRFGRSVDLSDIVDPDNGQLIDKGLILTFASPNSFTGEDVVELHVHGGRAVIDAIFSVFSRFRALRQAEAGEFTYRAFENSKIDLTQSEGLADLIASESEAQRIQALSAAEGGARNLLEGWLTELISLRALIEAEIDFVDEEDIPGSVSDQVWIRVSNIVDEIDYHLSTAKAGEIVRNGFRVTLLGRPNAGKSTLLNCLAGRDVAIVTDVPGTTRDLLEVRLNLDGQVVVVTDTAGIHTTEDPIEKEGIRRAIKAAEQSDMVIWLSACDEVPVSDEFPIEQDLWVKSKSDLCSDGEYEEQNRGFDILLSAHTEVGIDELVSRISQAAKNSTQGSESVLFSRKRQNDYLSMASADLCSALKNTNVPLEIRAEGLRSASDALGKLIGRVDVEDILGAIFSEFCVGK